MLFCASCSPHLCAAKELTPKVLAPLAPEFSKEVSPQLLVPQDAILSYSLRLQDVLNRENIEIDASQYIALVDRNPNVQAIFIYWGSSKYGWYLVGASPVSTGLPGQYDHFKTPLGVFEHSLLNPDFRSEGTKNDLGFRGYGEKGMRVYDFGWVLSERGWGNGAISQMRLQMHATDPELAEPHLGVARSKGCIRIPATLNNFLDRYGLLDEDYVQAGEKGEKLWVMRKDRTPTSTPGRYLVVIDSGRKTKLNWTKKS